VRNAVALFLLEPVGEIEELDELVGRPVVHAQEIAAFQVLGHRRRHGLHRSDPGT
jgi:hypothetical protein